MRPHQHGPYASWSWAFIVLALSAAVLLLGTCQLAKADMKIEGFAGVGSAFHKKPPNKLWHQEEAGFDTESDMVNRYFRFGVEVAGIRLAYFDLGGYRMDAMAAEDEECIDAHGHNGASVCSGRSNRYVTSGSVRGVSLGSAFDWRSFFVEGAATYVRRSFELATSDGIAPYEVLHDVHAERLYGFGYMLGGGYRTKTMEFGVWAYDDGVGARFNASQFPAGTHLTVVAGGEINF